MTLASKSYEAVQTMSVAQAIRMALNHFQNGEVDACAYLCDQVLRADANTSMAQQLIGLVAFQKGDLIAATDRLQSALVLDPNNQMLLSNMIEVFRSADRLHEAVSYGERAVAAGAKNAQTYANLALAYYDLGKLGKAKRLHKKALSLDPNHVASLNNLGSIARDEKDIDEAINRYRQVLAQNPSHHESRNNLTTVLIELDRLDQALFEIAQVQAIDPNNAEALRNQGQISLIRLDLDAAERLFRRALASDPKLTTAYIGLSQVLLEKNHSYLALKAAERAYEMEPKNAICLHQLGLVNSGLNDSDTAFRYYDAALMHDPTFVPSLMGRGYLYLEIGDRARAEAAFKAALDCDPSDTAALVALSRVSKPKLATDRVLMALEQELSKAEAMPISKQIPYRFGLADCYDALGAYDKAWEQYERGAALKRSTIRYDADVRDAQVDQIIQTFTPEFIAKLRSFANPTSKPIFVLGMPRSGTTLTETILASHSRVHGAGELADLRNLFEHLGTHARVEFPIGINQLSGEKLRAQIDAYIQSLTELAPNARNVTDKMPSNFDMIGLIHALLPNARIVHVKRNGMDSCFSGFTRLFERSQLHSYDQIEMGRYFNGYQRLMAHWEATLPRGAFYTLNYEELVVNRESEVRAMLFHCGLGWEDTCLQSHKTNRRVRTASVTQVREPIYTSSIARWESYKKHLSKLTSTLVD